MQVNGEQMLKIVSATTIHTLKTVFAACAWHGQPLREAPEKMYDL